MAKDTTEFTQQNSERAMEAVSVSLNWARELAEHNLDQSKVVLDGLFKITRKMTELLDDQASAVRQHSSSLTEKTLSNTFDFGHKLARVREPQEFMELQSEFISRQSQVIADQTKELGQKIMKGTENLSNVATASTARASRAA